MSFIGTMHVGSRTKGTEPQRQSCIFDTGSTNTWISSTLQEAEGDIESVSLLYDPELSNTFKVSDYQCSINFGSGKLAGVFGWDDIYLNYGSAESKPLHVRQ